MSTPDNNYCHEAVPTNAKQSAFAIAFMMLSLTFFSASMWAGGTLAMHVNIRDFFLSLLFGNLLLAIYSAILGYIGAKTGYSTHLLARFSFGIKGSWLASWLLSLTQIGWFGVGLAMFALPVSKVSHISPEWLIAIFGLLMTLTITIEGIKALLSLSFVAVPAITLLGSYSIYLAIQQHGGLSALLANHSIAQPYSYPQMLTIVIGTFIGAGTLTADFVRFGQKPKQIFWLTLVAFLIGNSLMFLFGGVGAKAMGVSDISEVMMLQGLLWPAIIVLGLNIWTTNDNALYASGLGMANITGYSSKHMSLLNGLLGTLCSLWLYHHFVDWLTLLSTLIPPIGGVIMADYWYNRKNYYSNTPSYCNCNFIALFAVAFGVLCAYFIPGIIPLNSVLGSILSYLLLTIIKPSRTTLYRKDAHATH